MKVLKIEPGKPPEPTEIEHTLKTLQTAVGGSIQIVYPFDDPVALICNEEGKFEGLPWNRVLYDGAGYPYDVIAGTFLITGLWAFDLEDLSDELAEKYAEVFKKTNEIVVLGGRIYEMGV